MKVGDWVRSTRFKEEGEVIDAYRCESCAVEKNHIYILIRGRGNKFPHMASAEFFTVAEPKPE